jgi:hypothetical protein
VLEALEVPVDVGVFVSVAEEVWADWEAAAQ